MCPLMGKTIILFHSPPQLSLRDASAIFFFLGRTSATEKLSLALKERPKCFAKVTPNKLSVAHSDRLPVPPVALPVVPPASGWRLPGGGPKAKGVSCD